MWQKVVFMGNSWVPCLKAALDRGVVPEERLFKRDEHRMFYIHQINGQRLYMIKNAKDNYELIKKRIKKCNVLIICLGGNDVAEFPGDIATHVHDLVQLANDLHVQGIADRVGLVEGSPRKGKNAFLATNVDFIPCTQMMIPRMGNRCMRRK